jgi:hypothetical protein
MSNHSQDPRGHSNAVEDSRLQSAVLGLLLEVSPDLISESDAAREIVRDQGFAVHDAFQRAVNDLIAVGLVQRSGNLILPTRAAIRFEELKI